MRPGEQRRHATEFSSFWENPLGHATQLDALLPEKKPRGQAVQFVAPEDGENRPATHARHLVFPRSAVYSPARHAGQASVRRFSVLAVPAKQSLHHDFPTLFCHWPASHFKHRDWFATF